MQIESKGNQLFNIPNTEAGKDFMAQATKYLNRPQYKMVKRGRGSRKNHGDQSFIPLPHAEWIALYINGGSIDKITAMLYEAQHKATKDNEETARLKRRVEALEQENHAAQIITNRCRQEAIDAANARDAMSDERDATEKYAASLETEHTRLINERSKAIAQLAIAQTISVKNVKVAVGMTVKVEGDTITVS